MSYYMGDYYRGDPGIGSFFGGLLKKVGQVATSFIPGIGGAVSKGIGMIPTGGGGVGKIVSAAKSQIIKHPVLSAAGAAGAIGGMGAVAEKMVMGHPAARGGHVLKHCGQPLKSGKIGKCHRRMNVTNPRALRRSIRRCHGFAKLAMRTIHIIHPKKKGRFGGFKRRRSK